jgi:hypothetical protein
VILSIGGAAEAPLTRAGVIEVLVRERKGFIRLAIQEGVAIRPVITFGEDSVFWVARWGWIRFLHRMCLGYFKLPVPILFWGRSGWPWMMVPPGKRLKVVVGRPLLTSCKKIEDPSNDLIDRVHGKYVDALVDLFISHTSGESVLLLS